MLLPLTLAILPLPAIDVPALMRSTEFARALTPWQLRALVPRQSGLFFVGCPNCRGGRQEGQLTWTPERPDEISCQYCAHRYPSPKYAVNGTVRVRNPRGEMHEYPYWADAAGYRYFFAARRDDLARRWLSAQARSLALLYQATKDDGHARRAAAILDEFARVFPGWCFHYDYPFRQKEIYEGTVPPANFRPNGRTARWTWWAYSDLPLELIEAYDWIRGSGAVDAASAARIERDLLGNAAEQVRANPEEFHNMSPVAWRSLVSLGRVLNEPAYMGEPLNRLQRMLSSKFFYDASWIEGAPSYAAQTLGGFANVLRAAGETDATLEPARQALALMRFPDGHHVPVHDTWWFDQRQPYDETKPYLLPALGHAMLGGGRGGGQTQFHLTWSGGYGHQHYDGLSLIAWANGAELLSDIGYTHTRWRSWTLATAAHNTVVIDGLSQAPGNVDAPSDGSLLLYDDRNPRVQVLSVDNRRAYPGRAATYRRTLVVIDGKWAADFFDVEGGRVHDYFLHGFAGGPAGVSTTTALEPLATLLPPGFAWVETQNEGEVGRSREPWYAYGFLRQLRSAPANGRILLDFTPRLRATLFAEPGSRLITGENPSVRQAQEDDQQLPRHMRPFALLRHEAAKGRSRFVAVLDPTASVDARLTGSGVEGAGWRIQVRGGAVRVRGPARYDSGSTRRAALAAVEGTTLRLESGSRTPQPGTVVRLVTEDGWTYPYRVRAAAPGRITVAEGPGFVIDESGLRFVSYPQRRHAGPARVEWNE